VSKLSFREIEVTGLELSKLSLVQPLQALQWGSRHGLLHSRNNQRRHGLRRHHTSQKPSYDLREWCTTTHHLVQL